MSLYDNLPQEALVDLLRAYDCYISTAADAGLLTTGWTPVCVEEFYGAEYQNVWDPEKGDESFNYMYDDVEREFFGSIKEPERTVPDTFYLNDVRIFRKDDAYMCQFADEQEPRNLRTKIQDIQDGDAFIVGCTIPAVHTADGAAHQNFDEPDEPWIVYDNGGDSWFEEDIVNPNELQNVLTKDDFIFMDEIYADDTDLSVNGYLAATDKLVNLLLDTAGRDMPGDVLNTMDNPNFYAVRNFDKNSFELIGSFDYYENEADMFRSVVLPLSESNKEMLKTLLDEYCVKDTGYNCADFMNLSIKETKPSLDSIINSASDRASQEQQTSQEKNHIPEK